MLSSEAESISISNLTTVCQPPILCDLCKRWGWAWSVPVMQTGFWPACSYSVLKSWFMPCIRGGLSERLSLLSDSVVKQQAKVSLFHPVWQKYLGCSLVQPVLLTLIHPSTWQVISGRILWMVLSLRCLSRLRKKFSIVLGWASRDSLWIYLM